MKKRRVIGLCVTALILSVIIGIASLPDEVLIKSTSVENSQTPPKDIQFVPTKEEFQESIPVSVVEKNSEYTNAEIDALKNEIKELKNELVELKLNSGTPEVVPTITKEENVTDKEESQGKVITIKMKDGVGAKMR